MTEQYAIRHHEFGKPEEVLRLETIEAPEPGPGEVRVRLLASCINPSDLGMIGGTYGRLRELPAVAGKEGVGEVEAVGPGVTELRPGTRVRFPGEEGAWREYAVAAENSIDTVPEGVPVEQAALSFVNPPTAYCLLHKIVALQPGDWIVQNAGNSAVGLSVIQLARAMGVKTISQVRRRELDAPLRELGADAVVVEGDEWTKSVPELTGGAGVRLALNSVGGASAIEQIKVLGEGGIQVTFGAMTKEAVRFPTRYLIFNDIHLRGFWWDRWARQNGNAETRAVLDAVHGHMRAGTLKLPVEKTYSFSEFKEALKHNGSPRLGKVLLRP